MSQTEEQTMSVAEALVKDLVPGDSVFLYGDLGVGKTVFVKGLARGLGIPETEITSASFVIISEHQSSKGDNLFHIDLYRLGPEETEDLGLEDYIGGPGIAVIEWAERLQGWEPTVQVWLAMQGPSQRKITIKSKKQLNRLQEVLNADRNNS